MSLRNENIKISSAGYIAILQLIVATWATFVISGGVFIMLQYPPIDYNQELYYLGNLCPNHHEHLSSGKSLRYKSNFTCFTCHNQRNNKLLSVTDLALPKPNVTSEVHEAGRLCRKGHKFNQNNYSLRYKSNGRCVECCKAMAIKLQNHARAYKKNNPEIIKAIKKREWEKNKHNPAFKLNRYMSSRIHASLNGNKNNRWVILVGYSVKQLIVHIEKQFDKNMSWDNYGAYWHIDHITPKSAFNFTSAEQLAFRKCWALSNLRPLEKTENLKKSKKLIKPFQTILNI